MIDPTSHNPALEETCIMCPRKGPLVCKVCKDARYCSKDCQTLDFKNHKKLCKVYLNIQKSRPSSNHRLALLFPGQARAPIFKWVELYMRGDSHGLYEDFRSRAEFGTEDKDSCSTNVNNVQGRSLARVKGEGIHWFKKEHNDLTSIDTLNEGLRNFTRSGACWEDFRGPVFVLRATVNKKGDARHSDMTMREVRGAADFLGMTYRDGYHQATLSTVVALGNRVASAGEVAKGARKFDDVVLNGCDQVWNSDSSEIANLIGLPLLCTTEVNSFTVVPNVAHSNSEVALLHLDVVSSSIFPPVEAHNPGPVLFSRPSGARQANMSGGPAARHYSGGIRGFGSSPYKYSIDATGTARVVRADGKPLPSQHLEAIVGFIKEEIEPKLKAAIAGVAEGQVVEGREDILKFISRPNFDTYYQKFRLAKIESGDQTWVDLPSPYDVKKSDVASRMRAVWITQRANGFEQDSERLSRQERGDFTEADAREAGLDLPPGGLEFLRDLARSNLNR